MVIEEDDLASAVKRGERLRAIRKNLLRVSRYDLGVEIAVSGTALKGWELGWGGGLTEKGSAKILNHLEKRSICCSEAWLMYGIGQEPKLANDYKSEERVLRELNLFRAQNANTLDLWVSDEAMLPFLYPDTLVAGILERDFSRAVGRESIVITQGYQKFVRVLEHGSKNSGHNSFNLVPLNRAYPRVENVIVIAVAPIVWTRRK